MPKIFSRLRARSSTGARKGQAIVEFGILAGLITGLALFALTLFGEEVDYVMCRATNTLGGVTGYVNESCVEEPPLTPEELGYGPTGFVDLYLAQSEVETRRVLLPVENFDIKGLSEIEVATDREDSVAACFMLEGGQVTCGSMQGLESSFLFPAEVIAVGYEILPVADPRIEMAQPVSITLGSKEDTSLNKTWNITVFRPAEPNLFAPETEFESIEFVAGTIGEQRIIEALRGKFSDDPLVFTIEPGFVPQPEGEEAEATNTADTDGAAQESVGPDAASTGQFGICSRGNPRYKERCGLIQAAPSATTIPSDGVSLGYEFFLPRDVRKPVSWPMRVSLASSFDEEEKKTWDIEITRVPGEAPAWPDLAFTDIEFPADTANWDYGMVELDQSYPSDLLVKIPQSDAGLKACYQLRAEGGHSCSTDAGDGEVEFIVPAGAHAVGLGVLLPQDVLSDYERRAAFEIHSVDYPDFSESFDLAITRPAFIVTFEPAIVFEDVVYPMGSTGWQRELVDMAGNFNSAQDFVLPEGQANGGVCTQGSEVEPEASPLCSRSVEGAEAAVVVPFGARQIGFEVDLGESEFQPVDTTLTFELRNAKDPSFMETYAVNVTRPATPIVFEPDTASMAFVDAAYPEATEDWQEPQLVPLTGTFNTDLLLKMRGGVIDAGLCYQLTKGADPICGNSALETAQELVVPNSAYAIGFRPRLSSDIHIEQDLGISFELTSAEGGEEAIAFAARVTRPAVPVRFDPNLGFRDKVFERGLTEEQNVFVPIEGEITTGLKMIIPQVDHDLRACYIAVQGDKPACSSPAKYGEVILEVPRDSAAVGYQVILPDDVHVDWAEAISFRVVSDYDESLDYDVAINASRETTPVAFAPDDIFADMEFPKGTTGAQEVLRALTGDVTTKTRVEIPMAGFEVAPCVQKTAGGSAICTGSAAQMDRSHQATWTKAEEEDGARFIHGVGYRVTLPEDIHTAFDETFVLRLVSQYDPSKSRDYQVRLTRPAVEVVWRPDASLRFPDAEFPVRSTGARDVMIPFAGTFTTATDYTIGETQKALSPCFAKDEGGRVECGATTESGASAVTLESDYSGIGYRIELPTDLAEEVDKTVQVDLRSAYDSSLSETQTFRIYREPAPVVFTPTVSFDDRTFSNGETGWQRDMERLTGELTTDLELFAQAGAELRLCVQDAAGEEPRCTTTGSGSDKVMDVAPTAHSIGYEVRLPDDPRTEDRQTLGFELRMKEFPSQRQQYSVSTHRPKIEMTFSPAISFGNETLEIADAGWFTFVEPLRGQFSSDIEFLVKNAGDDLKLCVQAVQDGPVSCNPATAGVGVPVDHATYAIGYAVNVGDDEFVRYERTSNLRLQSVDAPTIGEDYAPRVIRPERPVELPPSNLFKNPKVFEEGDAGYQDVMAPLSGVGNTPMRFEMSRSDFDARPCIQLTAQSPVACPAESTMEGVKSYAIDAGTYAVGYRVRLPQDPFDTFERSISMKIYSETVKDESVSYGVSLVRPVQMPIMPAEDLFENTSYPPGTTGTKTITAQLDPRIDTPLRFRKSSGHPDLALCYKRSHNGAVTCEGEGQSGSFEIVDIDQSWYAVGYRFTLDENGDNEVFRTLPLRLTSTRVSSAYVDYRVGISRMTMNAVMPDRTFFADKTYEQGETGTKTEVTRIMDDVNINMVLHKAAGQPGLELCYQQYSSWGVSCSGGDVEGEYSISISQDWYAMGYKFSLGDSKFVPFDETFDLHLTARDGWSNRVDYAIDVFRPHVPMILPAADMFVDVVLGEDETGDQYIMAPLDPAINTNLDLVKAADQPNLTMCRRDAGNTVRCDATNNYDESLYSAYMSDLEVGYKFNAGSSPFVAFDETFNFTLRSRDLDTEEVSYTVRATRPAKPVIMPPADAFTDVIYEEGTAGDQFVSIETADMINSNVVISGVAQDYYYSFCAQKGDGNLGCNGGISPSYGGEWTVSTYWDRFGLRFSIPANKYVAFDKTVTFSVTSVLDESKTVEYTIRLYRPAMDVDLPPADFFADIVYPAGTTGSKFVMKDLVGQINTNMQMYSQPESDAYYLCRNYEGRSSPYCPTATSYKYPRTMDFYTTDTQVGFRVPLPTNKFQDYENTFSFSLISKELSSARRDYEVKITRPRSEIKLPPEDYFVNVALPAGTVGTHYELRELAGHITTDMEMVAPAQSAGTQLCRQYPGRSSPYCYYSTSETTAMTQLIPVTDTHVGFGVPLPSNKFQDFTRDFTFDFVSKEDRSLKRTYAVRITRPRSEIKLPPEDYFVNVALPAGTVGTHYEMRELAGHITTDMEMVAPAQAAGTQLCRQYPGRSSPYCYYSTSETTAMTQLVKADDTHVGFGVPLPSNKFQDFSRDFTFDFVSKEDRTLKRTYTVRITRPRSEIKLPPENYFVDVEVPAGTVGTHYVMRELAGHITTDMEMVAPPQTTGTQLCRQYTGRTSPYCYYSTSESSVMTQLVKADDTHVGFGVPLPSNKFQDFTRDFTFDFISKEDRTLKRTYTVRVTRKSSQITMPPADLFQDVTVASTKIGWSQVLKVLDGHVNTKVRLDLPAQGVPVEICYVNSNSSTPSCGYYAASSATSFTFDPAFQKELGFQIHTGNNEFQPFDHTVNFTLTSVEDETKTVSYSVRVDRPRSEIVMPAADFFQDVTVASTKTAWTEVVKAMDAHITTAVRIDMPIQGANVEICYVDDSSSTVRCSWNSENSANSFVYKPDGHSKLGFRVHTGNNEFQSFDHTVNFTLTSVEDETKTVSYSVRVDRPRSEIAMPAADFFQDVTVASTRTGWTEVVKSLDTHITTAVRLDMPIQGANVEICYADDTSSTVRCSWNSENNANSFVYKPDGHSKLGFQVHTGNNEFQSFDHTVNFTLTSVEDETKTVSYSVRIKRPGSEIAMPAADFFQDVTVASTKTAWTEVVKSLDAHITTAVRIDMPIQGANVEICYVDDTSSAVRCGWNSESTANSFIYKPDGHNKLGFRVHTGNNEFQSFDHTVNFTLTSVEDETKTVSYAVRVHRPASQ